MSTEPKKPLGRLNRAAGCHFSLQPARPVPLCPSSHSLTGESSLSRIVHRCCWSRCSDQRDDAAHTQPDRSGRTIQSSRSLSALRRMLLWLWLRLLAAASSSTHLLRSRTLPAKFAFARLFNLIRCRQKGESLTNRPPAASRRSHRSSSSGLRCHRSRCSTPTHSTAPATRSSHVRCVATRQSQSARDDSSSGSVSGSVSQRRV